MASLPRKSEKDNSDFDPSLLLEGHGQHEKSISDLTERMARIEGHLATPQALASFFKESAKDSRTLEGAFAEMFCRFMKEHPDVKEVVRVKIEEIDRNFFYKNCKRLWFPLYSFILIFVTIIGKDLANWVVSLISHAK